MNKFSLTTIETCGYFFEPASQNFSKVSPESKSLWLRLETIIEQAKNGCFDNICELVNIYKEAYLKKERVLQRICMVVLGDIGTKPCFQLMIQEIQDSLLENPIKSYDFCYALRLWGNLSIIPTLIRHYEENYMFEENEIMPIHFSALLEPKWKHLARLPKSNEKEINNYCTLVLERYKEFKHKFGTDDILFFNGEPFGVIPFTKLILERLDKSYFNDSFQSYFRRKFEALTGINCKPFYKDGAFQALTTAAIVENFLESSKIENYKDGVRYFFNHRIPD